MNRTQIQLTDEQAAKAKRLAAERGVSMAEVIRDLIDEAPERDDRAERIARALAAVKQGGFRDLEGKTDVSVRHDEYLAEIFEHDLRKR
jgi:Arc/MetJ-type ribon-helix-helix transcriptional regulator